VIPDHTIPLGFCIPGDITLPTGGYKYDREVLAQLVSHGVQAQHVALPVGYPAPSEADLAATVALFSSVPSTTPLLIDGLALGAMPPALVAALPHPLIALVHHPLGLESGLAPERAYFLLANEKAVLAHARAVIVPSPAMAAWLTAHFDIPAARIMVAEPGVDRAVRAPCAGNPPCLLAVGAVSQRKAYDLLVEALAPLTGLAWQLTIVGALDRAPDAVAHLKAVIAQHGLDARVHLAGACSDAELAGFYVKADIFVASSLLEGYGMALTEALSRGLPIVTSTGGAAADTVPDSAALKVPPGDGTALRVALDRMLKDPALRRSMSDAAWTVASQLPTWDSTAQSVADAVCRVMKGTGT
jgi:glycosyltransferase involved in cell wall biosynthesis